MPRKELSGLDFTDIANQEILEGREQFGVLSGYVPFHFFTKNPFDCYQCRNHGPENLAIIAMSRERCKELGFKIIPSHPLSGNRPDICPYDDGFKKINWNILDDFDKRDYRKLEVRSACMAECISENTVPVEEFSFVYVYSEDAGNKICHMGFSVQVNDRMFQKPSVDGGKQS
jgi:hypothetical protein